MLSVTLVATVLSLASAARGQAASTSASSSGGVAGLIAGLSQSCQAAAGSLLSSDFGTCANIVGLVSVIGAQGSVVSPLTVSHTFHLLSNYVFLAPFPKVRSVNQEFPC